MDSFYLKPYHAIHWLENPGGLEIKSSGAATHAPSGTEESAFKDHIITTMPGVYRAVAGDLDDDGDMDIAACAYIPESKLRSDKAAVYDSLIWLEQRKPGEFVRHVVDRSNRGHMALDVGDTDRDGDLDIVVGGYGNQPGENTSWFAVWKNEGKRDATTSTRPPANSP